MKTVAVHKDKIKAGRHNACMVALTARQEIAVNDVKNKFEMARAFEPEPNRSNPMWKLCHDALDKLSEIENLQKQVHDEHRAFQQNMTANKNEISNVTIISTPSTNEVSTENASD